MADTQQLMRVTGDVHQHAAEIGTHFKVACDSERLKISEAANEQPIVLGKVASSTMWELLGPRGHCLYNFPLSEITSQS